jgi:Fur family zinc uptake transcriptional regulator
MAVSPRSNLNLHNHDACVADAVAAAEARAEAAAAKLTPLRRRVLELICASHVPVGAYHLMEQLGGASDRRAAPPTVYRALDFLMEHGLIHRINSLNAYVACFGPHRPHDACLLICEQCRTVEEVEADGLRRAIHRKGADAGFAVRGQTIEVTGLCRACRVGV